MAAKKTEEKELDGHRKTSALSKIDAEWVRKNVELLRARADTHESEDLHAMEDALWEIVVQAIVEGAKNERDLAAEILKTREINFPRWYS